MQIIQCEQRTDEWYQARLGMVTSSNFSNVISRGTGHDTYMLRVLAERLTGQMQDTYINDTMQRGIEIEPMARDYYRQYKECEMQEVGFVRYDDWVGGSPDGLVGEDGLIEIKCPKTTTHLSYILKNKFPAKYRAQVQGLLLITGRKWCDFVSFDPRLEDRPMWIIRVEPDRQYINELAAGIGQFVGEVKNKIEQIKSNIF